MSGSTKLDCTWYQEMQKQRDNTHKEQPKYPKTTYNSNSKSTSSHSLKSAAIACSAYYFSNTLTNPGEAYKNDHPWSPNAEYYRDRSSAVLASIVGMSNA